jgi:glutamate-1-semialdehyde aminotransferase
MPVGGKIFICEPIELDDSQDRKTELSAQVKSASLSIFDEIVTGFRVPKWTVASMWDIKPDIICLGKGIANGWPLSVVGGRAGVMNCGEYFISSTFSGEIESLFVASAVLDELKTKSMADLMFYGLRMQNNFNRICEPIGVRLVGYGTRAMLNTEHEGTQLLMQEMCKMGVLLGKAWFFNFSHLENNVEEYFMNLLSDAVNRIKLGVVRMEGVGPVTTFRR